VPTTGPTAAVELFAGPVYLDGILARGNGRANQVAEDAFEQARQAMGMT
jgi:hypothetical protein